MENINYKIYKAQNTITGECYIGATTKTIEERKLDHLQKASKGSYLKFHQAIQSNGANNFTWTQLDTAINNNDLAQKESKYILKFESHKKGYNSDRGGGIAKNVYQFNPQNGELINTFEDLEKASQALNLNRKSISNACLGYSKSYKGFKWSYSKAFDSDYKIDERKKSVSQFSLDEKFIKNFKSASEASRITGISKTCITRCCRGEREQTGGFLWKYI